MCPLDEVQLQEDHLPSKLMGPKHQQGEGRLIAMVHKGNTQKLWMYKSVWSQISSNQIVRKSLKEAKKVTE